MAPSSRALPLKVGEPWWQKVEAGSRCISSQAAASQECLCGTHSTVSQQSGLSGRALLLRLRVAFPTSVNLILIISHGPAQRALSLLILGLRVVRKFMKIELISDF